MIVEELLRCGLGHVVLCPGSRCAPLTVAVACSGCSHSLANDERGAAYMALGFARASGRLAAVIVSSGTAVANMLPAVVEASHDHIPLLLLTADRPPELRDTGANQTVQQVGMLDNGYLRWFKDVPCPNGEMRLEPLLSDADYAFARACVSPCGPVHLNIMLREPLAPRVEQWSRDILRTPRVAAWLVSRQPFTNYLRPYQLAMQQPDGQLLPLMSILRAARRGVLVVGSLFNSNQQAAASALSGRLGWPLFPDVCSGIRSTPRSMRIECPAVPLYDLLLSEPALYKAAAPDVVLQVGGRVVSKRLQARTLYHSNHLYDAQPLRSFRSTLPTQASCVFFAGIHGFRKHGSHAARAVWRTYRSIAQSHTSRAGLC